MSFKSSVQLFCDELRGSESHGAAVASFAEVSFEF
eukprot:SAG31_NODE_11905_length_987_cov_1.387387_2_plen_34_part_01